MEDKPNDAQKTKVDTVVEQLYVQTAELATRNKALSLLRHLDEVAIETLEPDVLCDKICRILIREFGFKMVGVMLRDDIHLRWSSLLCAGRKGLVCPLDMIDIHKISIHTSSHLGVKALNHGRRQSVSKMTDLFPGVSTTALRKMEDFAETHKVRTVFAYPLASEDDRVGALFIGITRDSCGLSHYERETIKQLLPTIIVSLQKANQYLSLQEATKKLKAANKKLKELDVLKTEFLSIASHELRTPLAVIKGYISTIQNGMLGKVPKKQESAIRTIADSAERLIFLVNHLLDVTRIESGRLSVTMVDVELTSVLKDVWKFVEPLAKEKKLQMRAHIPESTILVKADVDRIREIFVNVLDNAIKYTSEGSVDLFFQSDARYVTVQVRDTGFGLSAQDKERLFQKFAQGSASKHVKTTTGLGLYVVKKLLEAMGGSITAESPGIGRGSTFTIKMVCSKH